MIMTAYQEGQRVEVEELFHMSFHSIRSERTYFDEELSIAMSK